MMSDSDFKTIQIPYGDNLEAIKYGMLCSLNWCYLMSIGVNNELADKFKAEYDKVKGKDYSKMVYKFKEHRWEEK